MNLLETFIRRPVTTAMASLALVLFGILAYLNLPVREFPDVDPPVIAVTTILPGGEPAGSRVLRDRHPGKGAQHGGRAAHHDQREARKG